MAISSSYDENKQIQIFHATSSKGNSQGQSPHTIKRLMNSDNTANAASKWHNTKNINKNAYVTSDRVQLLSHLTEEKTDNKVVSSFQLAANIYKSNSDEFKFKKRLDRKNNKKSVLTLPNEPSIIPQTCTVSDMNDSEYFNRSDKPKALKPKKRLLTKHKRPPTKEYEFYDRDADYCSQMNIYLDCSSTDVVKNFKGDCRRRTKEAYNSRNKSDDDSVAPHDVWRVLRNINRFQFNPSPPVSDDSSIVTSKKKKVVKKKIKRGVYETCRTEQIAYISSIELNVKSRNCSPSGSSSIVTVIDNKDGFNNICAQVQKTFGKNIPQIKSKNNKKEKQMKAKLINKKHGNNCKALCYPNRSSECKSNNNKNASNDTLVEQKSEFSLKSESTSKRNQSIVDISCGGDICTEIEIQSGLKKTEVANKSRINSTVYVTNDTVGNAGALGDANHQNSNVYGCHIAREPFRRPQPSRGPCYISSNQPRLIPPARPLMSGPTKIIPGPPKSSLTLSKLEECPRSLDQTSTVPVSGPIRPFSPADIRKTVAKIKFPLVILGRDELSGNFKVENYDHPQFNGLDKQVWPFMLDWTAETRQPFEPDSKEVSYLCRPLNNQRLGQHTLNKQTSKDKKAQLNTDPLKYIRNVNVPRNDFERKNGAAKLKPILQFRDKMLKLLYKKASDQHVVNNSPTIDQGKIDKTVQVIENDTGLRNHNTVDVATSHVSMPRVTKSPGRLAHSIKPLLNTPPPPTSPSKILLAPKLREKKPAWSKAKWASEMIENVIRKIRNGSYYTNDLQSTSGVESRQTNTSDTNTLSLDSKEVSVQVTLPLGTGDFTPKITIQKKKEPLVTLPGFDDVLPPLEIKTMNRNQIAVKHCVTNVVFQFDVNVPVETEQSVTSFKRSTSCIPVTVTESKTKVFKCKARILNAMLPAELCSLIPKVMKQFVDKDAHLSLTLQEQHKLGALMPSPTSIILNPISELVSEIQETIKLPLLPQIEIYLHPEIRRVWDGRYSKNPKSWTKKSDSTENIYIIAFNELSYGYHSLEVGLLPRPVVNAQDFLEAKLYHSLLDSTQSKCPMPSITPQKMPIETDVCTDLVPYSSNAHEVCSRVHNVPQILKKFCKAIQPRIICSTIPTCFLPSIQLQTYNNHVSVNVSFGNDPGLSRISINLSNLRLGPLNHANTKFPLNAITNSECSEKRIEYIKHAEKILLKKTPREKSFTNLIGKYKRMGHVRYVKLYKKCKSTSHIAAERSSTPLTKVTNMDEFVQALGAGKLLSSAFDGSCGKKILTCISELKNWITSITPRQALLVMLLTNKKDTTNLVRFRPVILQGIAVNRITRVNELDMEIEVIERESFNKLSAYPGLPSVMQSTQNNDSGLFEELCWIAKTTASDYQRRFDESSEKLLRALLEKRKKLNPSYLRVMARYIGLGLLKTPANH